MNRSEKSTMKTIFVGPQGIRAGWRFAIFVILLFGFSELEGVTFPAGKVERKKWNYRFGAEYSSIHDLTRRPAGGFLSSEPKSCMASTELLCTPSAAVETLQIGTWGS